MGWSFKPRGVLGVSRERASPGPIMATFRFENEAKIFLLSRTNSEGFWNFVFHLVLVFLKKVVTM